MTGMPTKDLHTSPEDTDVDSNNSYTIQTPKPYSGSGTPDDPYVVTWLEGEPENPLNWPFWKKSVNQYINAGATFAMALNSSAYAGAVYDLAKIFSPNRTLLIMGMSLYVLGFAFGPLVWGPMSELYGRRIVFLISYGMFVCWCGAAIGAPNITGLLVFRLLQGTFGSSMTVNAAGVISDMFSAKDRGAGMAMFMSAIFLAPIAGPILGGFSGQYIGWQWLFAIITLIPAAIYVLGIFFSPETYAPVLLKRKAARLAQQDGCTYVTRYELQQGKKTPSEVFKTALVRPWQLLFGEPIVMCVSIWLAIVYGTLYLCFAAFPIVFQLERRWSSGYAGLSFLGIGVGMISAVAMDVLIFDKLYKRTLQRCQEQGVPVPPEARLPMSCAGAFLVPAGLFAFAWTASPASIHWAAPIILSAPFGAGMVCIMISVSNYIMECFLLYAASALAAIGVLRSLFGFAFPLFSSDLYQGLDINWATSLVAFLSVACIPVPFIFYFFGARIRSWSKRSAHSAQQMLAMQQAQAQAQPPAKSSSAPVAESSEQAGSWQQSGAGQLRQPQLAALAPVAGSAGSGPGRADFNV